MPLFFLLSGFSMAIGYHNRLFPNTEIQNVRHVAIIPKAENPALEEGTLASPENAATIGDSQPQEKNSTTNDSVSSPLGKYFYNRLIRVIPVYYICTCEAIPPTLYGYGNFNPRSQFSMVSGFVQSFIPTSTWTLFLIGIPLDGPGWTIATLYFFWICFPWLLKHYQIKSDEELLNSIVRCYWIQLFIIVILYPVFLIFGLGSLAFWVPTAFPPCRLPVFIMGMNAGLLCLRYANSDTIPWFAQSGSFLPWNFWIWNCCGSSKVSSSSASSSSSDKPNSSTCLSCFHHLISFDCNFQNTCLQQSIKLVCLTFLWTLLTGLVGDIGSNAWFQGINVFAQLDLIVGLVRINGTSLCSKVLRNPVIQWFGEISMALYLVHEPLIYYFCWFQNGFKELKWPSDMNCSSDDDSSCQDTLDDFNYDKQMQSWGIVTILPIATCLAALLYYGVEEPTRKYFK